MNDEIYKADSAFGDKLPIEVKKGYHIWAIPIAKAMVKSKLLTKTMAILAIPWAKEMAYRMGKCEKGNIIGKIICNIGVPACGIIGRLVK